MRHLLSLLVIVLTATLISPAYAQMNRPTIRSELSPDERKDWDAAKELFSAADYDGALLMFKKVYGSSKNPRVLYNIGVCEKNMHNYARAIRAWSLQFNFPEKLTSQDQSKLEASIKVVLPFVSKLELEVNEAGAEVTVKDDVIGMTPLTEAFTIDVGQQEVTIKKEGFKDKTVKVNVVGGEVAKLRVKLDPLVVTTRVRIEVKGPETARVFIDGVDMGTSPFDGDVEVGRHTFEARAEGYETARQSDELEAGKDVRMQLALVTRVDEGKLRIATGHDDAEIEIDGKLVGRGTWVGILPAGGHQLVVTKSGYLRYSADVSLQRDQVRAIDVVLEQERGTGWVWWTIGSVAVVAAAGVTSYFVLTPAETAPVNGTLGSGLITTRFR